MKAILKSVSRSFYLTIRFLPRPLRQPVGLAYLLARATDTIADTATIPSSVRLAALHDLAKVIGGERKFDAVAETIWQFSTQQKNETERRLIKNLRKCVDWLDETAPADRDDIRRVLETIVRGQELDLERFGEPGFPRALQTAAELDEYTYLVAGCVGQFWTNLGFRNVPRFAKCEPDELAQLGVSYGQGLQLINVLRDREVDLANGRDYLPADEVSSEPVAKVFARWLEKAEEKVSAGIDYSSCLTNWRVRFATVLPALIGARNLALMRASDLTKGTKVKVPRKEVYSILSAAIRVNFSKTGLRQLYLQLLRE